MENSETLSEMPQMLIFLRLSGALALIVTLAGCANGYKQFYKVAEGVTPESIAQLRIAPPPVVPIVERTAGGGQELVDAYAKRGFMLIGTSFFNAASSASEDGAIQHGKEIGSDLVLIFDPTYTGSVTSTIPISTPTTTTTYTTGTATVFGSGGPTTVIGTDVSTSYGTTTRYVPMTVHRSDFGAAYFVRRSFTLGAFFRELDDDERNKLQTNKGLIVRFVVDGSPAFDADLLAGDIVQTVDGLPVSDIDSLGRLITERKGRRIVLGLLRGERKVDLSVQLNL